MQHHLLGISSLHTKRSVGTQDFLGVIGCHGHLAANIDRILIRDKETTLVPKYARLVLPFQGQFRLSASTR